MSINMRLNYMEYNCEYRPLEMNYDLLKSVNWVMFDVLNYMCVIVVD